MIKTPIIPDTQAVPEFVLFIAAADWEDLHKGMTSLYGAGWLGGIIDMLSRSLGLNKEALRNMSVLQMYHWKIHHNK